MAKKDDDKGGWLGNKPLEIPGVQKGMGNGKKLTVPGYVPPADGKASTDTFMNGLHGIYPPLDTDQEGQVEQVPPVEPALEWGDRVSRIREKRQAEDDSRWEIGFEIVAMVEELGFDPKPGRPAANANVRTLGELAAEVDISSKRLSEAWKNASFYGSVRTFGDYATWAHHDLARRNADDVDAALRYLAVAKLKHLHYRAFQRWFEGILFEGELTRDELVTTWDGFVPPGKRVFVTLTLIDD